MKSVYKGVLWYFFGLILSYAVTQGYISILNLFSPVSRYALLLILPLGAAVRAIPFLFAGMRFADAVESEKRYAPNHKIVVLAVLSMVAVFCGSIGSITTSTLTRGQPTLLVIVTQVIPFIFLSFPLIRKAQKISREL